MGRRSLPGRSRWRRSGSIPPCLTSMPRARPSWTGKWFGPASSPALWTATRGPMAVCWRCAAAWGWPERPCWPSGLRSAVAPAWLRRRCRVRCIRPWRGKTSRRSTVCSRKHRTGWSRRRRAICYGRSSGGPARFCADAASAGGIRSRRWWRTCSRRPLARWYWTRMV